MVRIGPLDEDSAQAEVNAGRLPALAYQYQVLEQSEDGQRFRVQTPEGVYEDLFTPLLGVHQIENATVAIATLEMLRLRGIDWSEQALRKGIERVHWPARMQVVGHSPTIVVDGAHNGDSLQKLLATLRATFTYHRLIVVLGINKDKDLVRMIEALAGIDEVVLTHANNPRAVSASALQELFTEYAPGVVVRVAESSNEALDMAFASADAGDAICVTGSLYLAAEGLRWAAARGDVTSAADIQGIDH